MRRRFHCNGRAFWPSSGSLGSLPWRTTSMLPLFLSHGWCESVARLTHLREAELFRAPQVAGCAFGDSPRSDGAKRGVASLLPQPSAGRRLSIRLFRCRLSRSDGVSPSPDQHTCETRSCDIMEHPWNLGKPSGGSLGALLVGILARLGARLSCTVSRQWLGTMRIAAWPSRFVRGGARRLKRLWSKIVGRGASHAFTASVRALFDMPRHTYLPMVLTQVFLAHHTCLHFQIVQLRASASLL